MSGWWTCPDERTRREVDARVPDDRRFAAVTTVWAALRPLGPGVHEAEQVVHARYAALGDRVRPAPPDPLDVPSLAACAAAHRGRAAAIEAIWDGDTVYDWFVVLVAVLEDPSGEGPPATVYRCRGGPAPGTVAADAGRALADHLGVPFHFASPDVPDDEAPRRRATPRPSEEP